MPSDKTSTAVRQTPGRRASLDAEDPKPTTHGITFSDSGSESGSSSRRDSLARKRRRFGPPDLDSVSSYTAFYGEVPATIPSDLLSFFHRFPLLILDSQQCHCPVDKIKTGSEEMIVISRLRFHPSEDPPSSSSPPSASVPSRPPHPSSPLHHRDTLEQPSVFARTVSRIISRGRLEEAASFPVVDVVSAVKRIVAQVDGILLQGYDGVLFETATATKTFGADTTQRVLEEVVHVMSDRRKAELSKFLDAGTAKCLKSLYRKRRKPPPVMVSDSLGNVSHTTKSTAVPRTSTSAPSVEPQAEVVARDVGADPPDESGRKDTPFQSDPEPDPLSGGHPLSPQESDGGSHDSTTDDETEEFGSTGSDSNREPLDSDQLLRRVRKAGDRGDGLNGTKHGDSAHAAYSRRSKKGAPSGRFARMNKALTKQQSLGRIKKHSPYEVKDDRDDAGVDLVVVNDDDLGTGVGDTQPTNAPAPRGQFGRMKRTLKKKRSTRFKGVAEADSESTAHDSHDQSAPQHGGFARMNRALTRQKSTKSRFKAAADQAEASSTDSKPRRSTNPVIALNQRKSDDSSGSYTALRDRSDSATDENGGSGPNASARRNTEPLSSSRVPPGGATGPQSHEELEGTAAIGLDNHSHPSGENDNDQDTPESESSTSEESEEEEEEEVDEIESDDDELKYDEAHPPPGLILLEHDDAHSRELWHTSLDDINGVLMRNVTMHEKDGTPRVQFGASWDELKGDLGMLRAQMQLRTDFNVFLLDCVNNVDDLRPELVIRFRKFCEERGFAGAISTDGRRHFTCTHVEPMIPAPGPVEVLNDTNVQAFLGASTARQHAHPRHPKWGPGHTELLRKRLSTTPTPALSLPLPATGANIPILALVSIFDRLKHKFIRVAKSSGWPLEGSQTEDALMELVKSRIRGSVSVDPSDATSGLFAASSSSLGLNDSSAPVEVPLFESSVLLHATWLKFVATCVRKMRIAASTSDDAGADEIGPYRDRWLKLPLHPLAQTANLLHALAERSAIGHGAYAKGWELTQAMAEERAGEARGLSDDIYDQMIAAARSDSESSSEEETSSGRNRIPANYRQINTVSRQQKKTATSLLHKLRRVALAAKAERLFGGIGSGRMSGQREFGVKYREQDFQVVVAIQHELRVAGLLHNLTASHEVEVYGGAEDVNPTERRRDPRFSEALERLKKIIQLPEYNRTILAAFSPKPSDPNSGLIRLLRNLITDLTAPVKGTAYNRVQLWESDPAGLKVVYEAPDGGSTVEDQPQPLFMDVGGGTGRVEKRFMCVAEEVAGVLHFYVARGHPNLTEAILSCYLQYSGYSRAQSVLLEALGRTPPAESEVATAMANPDPVMLHKAPFDSPSLPLGVKGLDMKKLEQRSAALGGPEHTKFTHQKGQFHMKVHEVEMKRRASGEVVLDGVNSSAMAKRDIDAASIDVKRAYPEWGDHTDERSRPLGGKRWKHQPHISDGYAIDPKSVVKAGSRGTRSNTASPLSSLATGMDHFANVPLSTYRSGAVSPPPKPKPKMDVAEAAATLAKGKQNLVSDRIRDQLMHASATELLGFFQRTRKAAHHLIWKASIPPRQASLAMSLAREIQLLCKARLIELHRNPPSIVKAPYLTFGLHKELAKLVKQASYHPPSYDALWLILHACGGSMQLGRACDAGSAVVRDVLKSIGREAAVGMLQGAIRDLNPFIPREPDLTTVYIEMMGHSENAVQRMFEMSKFDLGRLLFRRIRTAMIEDEKKEQAITDDGVTLKKKSGYEKSHAVTLSVREYLKRFADGLFFMLPMLLNLLLVLSLGTGIYTSLRMSLQNQWLSGLAIMFSFVLVGGVNAFIARVGSYYAFQWSYSVMTIMMIRGLWGGFLVSVINSVLAALIILGWYPYVSDAIVFGGYIFLFSLLQLFMATLYSSRKGSIWRSPEGLVIVSSLVVAVAIVLGLFQLTTWAAVIIHFLALGASDLILFVSFLYLTYRTTTMYQSVKGTSDREVLQWFCDKRVLPLTPERKRGEDASVYDAALIEWYAHVLGIPTNHPFTEQQKFLLRARKHVVFIARQARLVFQDTVTQARLNPAKAKQAGALALRRAQQYSAEDSLIHWYCLLTGKSRPEPASAGWDEMLDEGKKTMGIKRKTDLPHRGGVLWDRTRTFVAHGALYYALMFADRFVRIFISSSPFFVPSNRYELAVNWAQVYLLLAVGTLEPVLYRREALLDAAGHARVSRSSDTDVDGLLAHDGKAISKVYRDELRIVVLVSILTFGISTGFAHLIVPWSLLAFLIFLVACIGLTGFMLGGFNMLFLVGAQQHMAAVAVFKAFLVGEVVATAGCIAAYFTNVHRMDFAGLPGERLNWEDFSVLSLLVGGWAYYAFSFPRQKADDKAFKPDSFRHAAMQSASMTTSGAKWIGTGSYVDNDAAKLCDALDALSQTQELSIDTHTGRAAAQLVTEAMTRHAKLNTADHIIAAALPDAAAQLSHILKRWHNKTIVVHTVPSENVVLEVNDRIHPAYIPFAALSRSRHPPKSKGIKSLLMGHISGSPSRILHIYVAVDPHSPSEHARIVAEALLHESYESLYDMPHPYSCGAELLLHTETEAVGLPLRMIRQLEGMSDLELVILEQNTDIKVLHHAMLGIANADRWTLMKLHTKHLLISLVEAIDPNRYTPPVGEDKLHTLCGLSPRKYELAIADMMADTPWASWTQRIAFAQLLSRLSWALKQEARVVLQARHNRTALYTPIQFQPPFRIHWDQNRIMVEEPAISLRTGPKSLGGISATVAKNALSLDTHTGKQGGSPRSSFVASLRGSERPSSRFGALSSVSGSAVEDISRAPRRAMIPFFSEKTDRATIVLSSISPPLHKQLLQDFDTYIRLYFLSISGDESYSMEVHAARKMGKLGEPGGIGMIGHALVRAFVTTLYWISVRAIRRFIWLPANIFDANLRLFSKKLRLGLFKTLIYDDKTRRKVVIVQRHHPEMQWTGFVKYDEDNHVDFVDIYPGKILKAEPKGNAGRQRRVEYVCNHVSRILIYKGTDVVKTVIFGYGDDQLSMEELADPPDAFLVVDEPSTPEPEERRPTAVHFNVHGSGILRTSVGRTSATLDNLSEAATAPRQSILKNALQLGRFSAMDAPRRLSGVIPPPARVSTAVPPRLSVLGAPPRRSAVRFVGVSEERRMSRFDRARPSVIIDPRRPSIQRPSALHRPSGMGSRPSGMGSVLKMLSQDATTPPKPSVSPPSAASTEMPPLPEPEMKWSTTKTTRKDCPEAWAASSYPSVKRMWNGDVLHEQAADPVNLEQVVWFNKEGLPTSGRLWRDRPGRGYNITESETGKKSLDGGRHLWSFDLTNIQAISAAAREAAKPKGTDKDKVSATPSPSIDPRARRVASGAIPGPLSPAGTSNVTPTPDARRPTAVQFASMKAATLKTKPGALEGGRSASQQPSSSPPNIIGAMDPLPPVRLNSDEDEDGGKDEDEWLIVDNAIEIDAEYFHVPDHPADVRIRRAKYTCRDAFGVLDITYNDISLAVTEVRMLEHASDTTELVSRYRYTHPSHPDIATFRVDPRTGKETRHETPLHVINDEYKLIHAEAPMSFAEDDPLAKLSKQRTDVSWIRRAVNALGNWWLPKSVGVYTRPYGARQARMLLWTHWEQGQLEGAYAQSYDQMLLRDCKVLRPYWRLRDWGFVEQARRYILSHESIITPTISFPSHSHLMVRITDLVDFVPGGESHRQQISIADSAVATSDTDSEEGGARLEQSKASSPFASRNRSSEVARYPYLLKRAGALPAALISPLRPLLVMGLDSGTWPADGGGVASCRRDLINRLPRLRWDMVSEIGSTLKLVQRAYQIEKNVTSMTLQPLWGVDLGGPNQSVLSHVPFCILAARIWRTTPEAINRYFVPLVYELVAASNNGKPQPRDMEGYGSIFVNIYNYFQRFDWTTTWESALVHEAWRRAWLIVETQRSSAHRRVRMRGSSNLNSSASTQPEKDEEAAGSEGSPRRSGPTEATTVPVASMEPSQWGNDDTLLAAELPQVEEIDEALGLFMHFLMPLAVTLPNTSVVHGSHHGVQSVMGAVAKRLRGAAFAIWDHGILWRERLVACSELYVFPIFVRNLLIGLTRLVVTVNFETMDVAVPCCSINNPDWEARLGGLGLDQSTADMWRRISPVINGMETDRFHVKRHLESSQPTAVMLSHVYDLKDVKNAILAAGFVVGKYQITSYRLLIYGSLDKDLEYVDECRGLIADLHLAQNVQLKGLGNASNVLPEGWVFVNSSKSEGLPLALGEAGLAGLPVVCTDVGASSEVITSGSECYGCVVPARNPEALARGQIKVMAMLEDLEPLGQPPRAEKSGAAPPAEPKMGPMLDSYAPIMPGGPDLTERMLKMGKERHRLGMRLRAYVLRAYTMKRYLREHEQVIWLMHLRCRARLQPDGPYMKQLLSVRAREIVISRSDKSASTKGSDALGGSPSNGSPYPGSSMVGSQIGTARAPSPGLSSSGIVNQWLENVQGRRRGHTRSLSGSNMAARLATMTPTASSVRDGGGFSRFSRVPHMRSGGIPALNVTPTRALHRQLFSSGRDFGPLAQRSGIAQPAMPGRPRRSISSGSLYSSALAVNSSAVSVLPNRGVGLNALRTTAAQETAWKPLPHSGLNIMRKEESIDEELESSHDVAEMAAGVGRFGQSRAELDISPVANKSSSAHGDEESGSPKSQQSDADSTPTSSVPIVSPATGTTVK